LGDLFHAHFLDRAQHEDRAKHLRQTVNARFYTSNVFAILGLRALYFALAAMIHRFRYLKPALAVVLIFIGSKIFVADLLGLEKFPPLVSLGATMTIIAAGILWSLDRTRRTPSATKLR
jgi:predicted tellurium resistance membrane protein TerC